MTIQEENQKNDILTFPVFCYSRNDKFNACKRSTSTKYGVSKPSSIEVDLFQKDKTRRSLITTTLWEGQVLTIKTVAIEWYKHVYNTISLTHVRRTW